MSTLGQKRVSEYARSMSALPSKADIGNLTYQLRPNNSGSLAISPRTAARPANRLPGILIVFRATNPGNKQRRTNVYLPMRGPKRGLLVITMLQTAEFFQEQIKQCRDSAARSHNKGDHDFWLKMARRWEVLLQIRQPDCAGPKTRYRTRLHHLRFARRRRAA
jgi:hypothetical protein